MTASDVPFRNGLGYRRMIGKGIPKGVDGGAEIWATIPEASPTGLGFSPAGIRLRFDRSYPTALRRYQRPNGRLY